MADTLTFSTNGLPLIFCTCGGLPSETTAKPVLMTNIADTVAAGEAKITTHPFLPGTTKGADMIITMEAATDDDTTPAQIVGIPSEVHCVPLELPEDSIIQATTLQFMAWGK